MISIYIFTTAVYCAIIIVGGDIMVRVTYGSKFEGDPWSYEVCRYEYTEYYLQIGEKVASYIRQGATKVSIKVEIL